ncbi:hypothetical protein, partial [Streptomyces tricolor]|uniref:hypothetical protein n=1 Tax=Streptomyces tricolor TaxID=68277 RepID=UPI0036E01389
MLENSRKPEIGHGSGILKAPSAKREEFGKRALISGEKPAGKARSAFPRMPPAAFRIHWNSHREFNCPAGP